MDYKILFVVVAIILLSSNTYISTLSYVHAVTINNNGYEDITVALSPSITQTSNANIIDKIRQLLTVASGYLYTATRRRAYFRQITIVLPSSWSTTSDQSVTVQDNYWNADIQVDSFDRRLLDIEFAYVLRTGGCSVAGHSISMSPLWLDRSLAGREMVQLWAQYRYGVFEEYAMRSQDLVYLDSYGKLQTTRCSASLTGNISHIATRQICKLPYSDQCKFSANDPSMATASIMLDPHLNRISEFCDDNKSNPQTLHNRQAINRQNNFCRFRSVWDVISSSNDFAKGNNLPRNLTDVTPIFTVVRQAYPKIVIAIDISNSMRGEALTQIRQSIAFFLQYIIRDGQSIGLVTIDSSAHIKSRLVSIKNTNDRQQLINLLPTETAVTTVTANLTAGLLTSVQLLRQSSNSSTLSGGVVIIITGSADRNQVDQRTFQLIRSNKITVLPISIGQLPPMILETVATISRGKSYYAIYGSPQALVDTLLAIDLLLIGPNLDGLVQLYSNEFFLSGGVSSQQEVIIDNDVGNYTEFLVIYQGRSVRVILTSPTGKEYTPFSPEYTVDNVYQRVRIYLGPNQTEIGSWKFEVTNPDSVGTPTRRISVFLLSRASLIADNYPLTMQLKMDGSQISFPQPTVLSVVVRKGFLAVVGCQVSGTVARPSTNVPSRINFRDDGAGADITKDDGIYSAYFTEYSNNGRYSMLVTVTGTVNLTKTDTHQMVGLPNSDTTFASAVVGKVNKTITYLKSFTRMGSGHCFYVINYTAAIDNYPPCRIHDLTVLQVNYRNATIALQWTAPGSDMDTGTAQGYELRMSNNFTSFTADFNQGSLINSSLSSIVNGARLDLPKSAGSVERIIIKFEQIALNKPYVFAIRSYDDVYSYSSVSNYAQAIFLNDFVVTSQEPNKGFAIAIVCIVVVGMIIFMVRWVRINNYNAHGKKNKYTLTLI
ncbi:Calcium-activated chloride channel regulator 2 [Trichoplax sp. H2]|nr:Calcium-activated chloride channel regulator 2 [Trichoplax sp. H2]|eukprot:RDD39812.1 Calcium-activated chloride channel regulator 2 [Trichoplax sp. H2]